MKKISIGIGLATFVTLMMLMSVGTAMADTEAHVDWNSPNPDIEVSTYINDSANAQANVSGSGGIASGDIVVTGSQANWATATASQTASFEGGDYTASVGAEGLEGGGGSGSWQTSHSFEAEGSSSAEVFQGASAYRSPNKATGVQSYKATGADNIVAVSSAYHYMCCVGPREREIDYTGTAEGDVKGGQAAYSESWVSETGNDFDVGLGADISGTEGTATFEFDADHASNSMCLAPHNPEHLILWV